MPVTIIMRSGVRLSNLRRKVVSIEDYDVFLIAVW